MTVTFNTDDVKVYSASAGTGKTYALMREMQEMLKVYRPEEIAFTTFTRKGVSTGIERALQIDKSLTPDSLCYFQTLHKMCFKESGMTHKNILQPADIMRFNSLCGFKVSPYNAGFDAKNEDTKMLQRYDSLRGGAKEGVFVESLYDGQKYNRLVRCYEKFKKANGLADFFDCLLAYLDRGKPLPVAAFFLDEAQDITALQWQVVMKASANAEKVRVSGDEKQTLFDYSGADAGILIGLAERYETVSLDKSYRLPKKVCVIADAIVDLMERKIPCEHVSAKQSEGSVNVIGGCAEAVRLIRRDYEANGRTPGKWYCLFQTNFNTAEMRDELEKLLVPYHTSSGFVICERDLRKLIRYHKYGLEGYGSDDAKAKFAEENGIRSFDADFTETALIPGEKRWLYKEYIERYGLEELERMSKEEPYCLLATTYKVKGGEAENVIVFTDATKLVSDQLLVDLDAQLRVFYTACTRAKENLYFAKPSGKYNIWRLVDALNETLPEGVLD